MRDGSGNFTAGAPTSPTFVTPPAPADVSLPLSAALPTATQAAPLLREGAQASVHFDAAMRTCVWWRFAAAHRASAGTLTLVFWSGVTTGQVRFTARANHGLTRVETGRVPATAGKLASLALTFPYAFGAPLTALEVCRAGDTAGDTAPGVVTVVEASLALAAVAGHASTATQLAPSEAQCAPGAFPGPLDAAGAFTECTAP